MSRVGYGRRAASRPSVSRSPSPNRTYTFCYVSGSPEATACLSYTAENVSLHAGDRAMMALTLCTQSIPQASKRLGLLPPFAMWTAFPSLRLIRGLRPAPCPSPVSTDSLCAQADTVRFPCSRPQPMWMVRCLLYPWRSWRETKGR